LGKYENVKKRKTRDKSKMVWMTIN